MDEQESNIISTVTDAISGVPEVLRKPLYKACADIIGGLVAVPAAKLDQYVQSIKNTTSARSLSGQKIAQVVAEHLSADPEILAIAAEAYMPVYLRKTKNKIGVVKAAANHLSNSTAGHNHESAAAPDDDWMNRFMRFAEDASSERMQDLFGRILAGQVARPGAFGISTLRTLSELDQLIAEDFMYAWSLSVGESVDYNSEWQIGEGFVRWKRLSEAGLMAPTETKQYLPPYKNILDGNALWVPVNIDGFSLLVQFEEGSQAGWHHIAFTKVGREIGSIIDKPDYEKNIRAMGSSLRQHGIKRVDFLKGNSAAELIWKL